MFSTVSTRALRMLKSIVLALAVIGLAARGYFMYAANQAKSARQTLQSSQQTIDQIKRGMHGQGADAEADAAAFGKDSSGGGKPAPVAPVTSPTAKSTVPASTILAQTATPAATPSAADLAARQEIETALKNVHLTTIMPGSPGVVIIDKVDYSEGDELPLPNNRRLKIVSVQDDGVKLTGNGMTFHLAAPTGPDLAALRKKK